MTITIKCKLDLTEGQRSAIDNTMETFASACNDALKVGREAGTTSNVHIDVEEPPPDLDGDHAWIGVDLGIVQLATLDDGTSFSGEEVDRVRDRYNGTRASLQSKGMKGAKRVLRRLRGRERRFQQSVHHCISKRIVEKAKAEGKGVRVEDLTGIREKMRVRRSGRYRHPSWAFYQLRTFLRYKCALAGVPFDTVDAAYTSRTCPECGHEEKANRKGQDQFVCQACGHEENADVVGARNIKRGGVCQPPQDESQEVASKVGVEIPA